MTEIKSDKKGEKEKRVVAASSVGAAIFITGFKLIVGLVTSSLGILAEAAHSALDLVAAAVTLFAVRASDKPADEDHPYGHGKIENLSALFEAVLLLITCAWIIYEAIQRLFFTKVDVEISVWSFIVMAVSIIVDFSRSRALMKAAKKHNSQALEADAIHFSTDIWSSSVVIGGLILITVGKFLETQQGISPELITWLNRADSIAALGVSLIVIYVSFELASRTIAGLLDAAPKGLSEKVKATVSLVDGVEKVNRVRLRPSGPSFFVEVNIGIVRTIPLEMAWKVAEIVQARIQDLIPRCDVIVSIDPIIRDGSSLDETIRSVASRYGIGIHNLRAHEISGKITVELHAEVDRQFNLQEAHQKISDFEEMLAKEIPDLERVTSHIEPLGDADLPTTVIPDTDATIERQVNNAAIQVGGIMECHDFEITRNGDEVFLTFHCIMNAELKIDEAHAKVSQLEKVLYKTITGLTRVIIHSEPDHPENLS